MDISTAASTLVSIPTTDLSLATNLVTDMMIKTTWTVIGTDMIFIVVTIVMGVGGTAGNLLVIGAVCVHPKLRSLANVFVINLAVADLCVSAFLNAFIIVGILTHGDVFDAPWVCHIFASICLISCTSSLWNVTAVSINRYVSICHHMVYRTYFNKRTVPVMVLAVWVIGVLSDLPNFIGWNRHIYEDRFLHCAWDTSENDLFKYYLFFVAFGLPSSILVFCYSRILTFFRASKMALKKVGGKDGPNSIKTVDLRLLRSVAVVLGAFGFFWGPYVVFAFSDWEMHWSRNFYMVGVTSAHLSSCINSIIYATTNVNFREGYLICWKRCFHGCRRENSNRDQANAISRQLRDRTTSQSQPMTLRNTSGTAI